MKYACLVYLEDEKFTAVPDAECAAFGSGLARDGKSLGGEALRPISAATTVRVREGKVAITDGPFAETKEQLGGFFLIEAADLEEATRIASGWSSVRIGTIEVRPVDEELSTEQRY